MNQTKTTYENNNSCPPEATAHFTCTSEQEKRYRSAFDDLRGILEAYVDWKDDLSERIFDWSAELLSFPFEIVSEDEKVKFVAEAVDILVKRILINPLDGSPFDAFSDGSQPDYVLLNSKLRPLNTPYLDREWEWGHAMLVDYTDAFDKKPTLSPFDAKPIEAVPHLLVGKMLAWAKGLSQVLPETSQHSGAEIQALLVAGADGPGGPSGVDLTLWEKLNHDKDVKATKVNKYIVAAQLAIGQRQVRQLKQQILIQRRELRELNLKLRDLIRKKTEEAARQHAAHAKEMAGCFAKMEKTQNETEAHYKEKEAINADRLNKAEQRTAVQAMQMHTLEGRIHTLQQQVAHQQRQLDEMKNKDSGCHIL